MLELATCPEPTCGAPAEVTDRFTLPSTDGPIEHVTTYCASRHIFMLPADRVNDSAAPLRTGEYLRRG